MMVVAALGFCFQHCASPEVNPTHHHWATDLSPPGPNPFAPTPVSDGSVADAASVGVGFGQDAAGLPVTVDVFANPGCGGHYCGCVTSGQVNVPDSARALAICRNLKFTNLISFTTAPGPLGQLICNATATGCYVNANAGNIVCQTVTCQ
jgi:hypothetical protein